MDLHHKLRRPRGSSIHACNICGKEGHQAAQCPNGTVAWGERFKANWGGVTWGLDMTPRHADLFRHPWHKEAIEYPVVRMQAKDYAAARIKKLDSGELDLGKEAEERAARKAVEMEQKKFADLRQSLRQPTLGSGRPKPPKTCLFDFLELYHILYKICSLQI